MPADRDLLATDALVGLGMEVAPYTGETKAKLKKALTGQGEVNNPLDLVAGAGGDAFEKALRVVKNDRNFDSIFTIFVPPVTINQMEVAKSILEGIHGCEKPVYACFMGAGEGSAAVEHLKEHGVPVYIFPEAVAKTLSLIDQYRRWLERPKGQFKTYKVDKKKVQEIIDRTSQAGEKAIVGRDALEILDAYGIPAALYEIAYSEKEAVAIAEKAGYPVVLKINTPPILHKTEFGGVVIDLRTAKEVREAFNNLKKKIHHLKKNGKYSVVIQEMVGSGVETVIGMSTDPSFGPLIMFGLGGIYVEILKDVAFRIHPLTDNNVDEMMKSLKSYPLLTGFRGAEPVDMNILKESLLRLSQLITDFDQFSEIDINPFMACPAKGKSKAVDARFIIRK